MEPIRILHVITGLGSGGAESLIMNWYRNIDRNLIQFDFLLRSEENIYSEEIKNLGGRVFYTPEYPKHYFKNKKETNMFFKEHIGEFKAIHVHGNALLYVNVFKIAKKYGIEKRIFHCHSTHSKKKLFEVLHAINKKRIKNLATDYFACSDEAGKFAFNDLDYKIIKNGINLKKFDYNPVVRSKLRQELKLDEKFVIGHVGRFLEAKNHEFIVDIFENVSKKMKNATLVLIGSGPLEEKIKNLLTQKKLHNYMFLGERKDIESFYQIMDVFVFPSKYEGFGIATIEAQASGLYCLISNTIPNDVIATNHAISLPIDSASAWSNTILNINSTIRTSLIDDLKANGFDITDCISNLQDYYLK